MAGAKIDCLNDERLCSDSICQSGYFRNLDLYSEHSEEAADRVEQAIYDACAFVADGPLRGHVRPGLTGRPLRFWTLTRYPNYSIVYLPETMPLQVVAVIHGKRNLKRVLTERT